MRCSQRGFDPQIDLPDIESGRLEIEAEIEFRQFLKLLGEQPIIPLGNLRQAIVGDHEGPPLGSRQMLNPNRWSFRQAEAAGG
jgi:hypothetical protein